MVKIKELIIPFHRKEIRKLNLQVEAFWKIKRLTWE